MLWWFGAIRLTGTPCVNPAATLQRGFGCLSMLAAMQAAELPLMPQSVGLLVSTCWQRG